jgi:uncharacterized protein (DUF697 family)
VQAISGASEPQSEQQPAVAQPGVVPVAWLLGKVQSGKTSIVRELTGCTDAEIGSGYRPCTRTAQVFDFPASAPLIRFLDTRGLGEIRYDPAADIAACEGQAHLLLVVMKALDQEQSAVLEVVRAVRTRRPDWPIVVAQTTLHDGYKPGSVHPEPYPFADPDPAKLRAAGVLDDLVRSLARQRSLFETIPGTSKIEFVPLDFTLADDPFQPHDYGLPALLSALREAAPASLAASIRQALTAANAALAVRAQPQVIGYATAAAAADVLPLAGVVAVPAIQAKMLHSLATIYGVPWDRWTMAQFAGCLGTGTVVRMLSTFGIRELVKLVPWYGQTAGAAAAAATSFATTVAVGKAAGYFLGQRRLGESDPAGVQRVYAQALQQAFMLAPRHPPDGSQMDPKA